MLEVKRYCYLVFRERARSVRNNEDLSRPLRLVSLPARLSLAAALVIIIGGGLYLFGGQIAVTASAPGVIVNPPGNTLVSSLVDGTVVRALPPVGARVSVGELVTDVRRVDGTLQRIHAPITGHIVSHSASLNTTVQVGDALLTIAPDTEPMTALLFSSARSISTIVPGLPAEVSVTTLDPSQTGVLLGAVTSVSPLPVTDEKLALILDDDLLFESLTKNGPVHEVIVSFGLDPEKPLGLAWSGPGPEPGVNVVSGAIVVGQFILREQSPWQALLGIDSGSTVIAENVPAPGPTEAQLLPVGAILSVGQQEIELEVATTPLERETGLMFRKDLPRNRGMIFNFDTQQPITMWMRDTFIPLDIIFVNNGKIVGIDASVPPCEEDPCPTYPSPSPVDSVIELAAGRAAELGLETGSILTIDYR